jgi:hypothetical protein
MYSHWQEMLSQICSHGSMVRAVRFTSEKLPVLMQKAWFCLSGTRAPTLFKSWFKTIGKCCDENTTFSSGFGYGLIFGSQTFSFQSDRPGVLPPRADLCSLYTLQKWYARKLESQSTRVQILLPNSSLFTQAQFKRLCTTTSNCNVNGQWFECKQISIYFYNPGFWPNKLVPCWFLVRVTIWISVFTCHEDPVDDSRRFPTLPNAKPSLKIWRARPMRNMD